MGTLSPRTGATPRGWGSAPPSAGGGTGWGRGSQCGDHDHDDIVIGPRDGAVSAGLVAAGPVPPQFPRHGPLQEPRQRGQIQHSLPR